MILKNQFGYTPEQVIYQNFKVSLFQLLSWVFVTVLCNWVHPLKILKIRSFFFYFLALVMPFLMNHCQSPNDIFVLQSLILIVGLSDVPAVPVFIIYFPVFRRFTCESLSYALSRAVVYVLTSVSLVYLTNSFGHYGLWVIMIPVSLMFVWGLNHFENLEHETRHDNPETALHRKTS